MTKIYGLREVGCDEIRYVGFTNQPLPKRLAEHRKNARAEWPYGPTDWMRSAGEIEIVRLCACPMAKARRLERKWVVRLHSEGHRLTNRHLLPAEARRTAA